MKKLFFTLSLVLSFSAYAASNCQEGEQNCWDCGKTSADLCTARLNGTNLSITGSGKMKDYESYWNDGDYYNTTPWGINYQNLTINGVQNIGEHAFSYAKITEVSLGDSIKSIGASAFHACWALEGVKIPDSVTSIGERAFFQPNGNTTGFFVPESVTSIETTVHKGIVMGPFEGNLQQYKMLYCAETSPCFSSNGEQKGLFKTYTKDENGVYKVEDDYYASPDDIIAQISCGSGNSAPQTCIDAASEYQQQKAAQMAGGALCKTPADCLLLIDMSNKKDVCPSIADCKAYGYTHGIGFGYESTILNTDGSTTYFDANGKITGYKGKRIYTIDEANRVAGPINRISITYR